MRTWLDRAVMLAIVAAGSLGLAGCGDDDDDYNPPPPGEDAGADGAVPDGGEGEADGGPDGGGAVDAEGQLQRAFDAQVRANAILTDPELGQAPADIEAALVAATPDLEAVGTALQRAEAQLRDRSEDEALALVEEALHHHEGAMAIAALVPGEDVPLVPIRLEELVAHSAVALSNINLGLFALGAGPSAPGAGHVLQPTELHVPAGYDVQIVAADLAFATALTFDEDGGLYVAEAGYSYGNVTAPARVLRLESDGDTLTPVIEEGLNGPVNGLEVWNGYLVVSHRGVISRFDIGTGERVDLVTDLPSGGDHQNNDVFIDGDGDVYFTQGTVTNTGVVGLDNYIFGWLPVTPDLHDIACRELTLTGANFRTGNPLTEDPSDTVETGAYVPFGTATESGQVIPASVPCNGSVMRVTIQGENLASVADGLRNPYALALDGEGRLFISENGPDQRGSRRIDAGDNLWQLLEDGWYGWPDYYSAQPTDAQVLVDPPELATLPFAVFDSHAAITGFSFSSSEQFAPRGTAFVASFGSLAPVTTGGNPEEIAGHQVYAVDASGGITPFLTSDTYEDGEPLLRAVDARVSPDGLTLYVTHFGEVRAIPGAVLPTPDTGALIRIRLAGGA